MKNNLENRDRIDKALQAENPTVELEAIVHILLREGFTRSQIYKLFLAYQVDNQEKEEWLQLEKIASDHPVMDILDRLWGWCHPSSKLLKDKPLEE